MRLVAKVFGALVAVWLALIVASLFLPGRYRVSRSALVSARPARIFPLVEDLRAWRLWGVWFARDPAMQIRYSERTTGTGAWSEWTSRSEGDGRMTVTAVRPAEEFDYRMEFLDMGMAALGSVALAPEEGGRTRVTLTIEGDLGRNPVHRWFGLLMDRLSGPDFEAGLANLKRVAETAAAGAP